MEFVKKRRLTAPLCGAAMCLGAGIAAWFHYRPALIRLPDGRIVPPWGLKLNPNDVLEPDVRDAEEKFKRIYAALLRYRSAKGRLPTAQSELGLSPDDLTLSGGRRSDRVFYGWEGDRQIALELLAPRGGGVPKPAFPKGRERDAWLSTDIFLRSNAVVYPSWDVKTDRKGFYLVLWSDGSIERIAYGRQLWVQVGNSLEATYPGQAGVPRNAKSNDELVSQIGGAIPAIKGNPYAPTPR